jgi:hypothetical protein
MDVQLRNQVTKKLHTVRERGYIAPGTVKSLTSYFPAPKGPDDIRMVYNGTKCGLNHVVWAPWFALPTIEEHLCAVTVGTYMADLDVSEQFLNFILSEDLQPYAGVDLTPYFGSSSKVWARWNRCFMGFTASPFCAAQGMMHAEEFVKGDPSSPSNTFRYDSVVLNLPGQRNYRPHLPWVFKSHLDGAIACDLFIYVDDSRTTGPSEEECWAASRQYGYTITYLGLQDAARKRWEPSMVPGPWAGSIVDAAGGVFVLISQECWDKVKGMPKWLREVVNSGLLIDRKTLESYRGYLVYISCTYPFITPYLKGIHLTLDSWRPWRKEDGWKMTLQEIKAALSSEKGLEVDFEAHNH